MLDLPFYIPLIFILITLSAFVFFVFSMLHSPESVIQKKANIISLILLMWLIFQATLALNKWFMDRKSLPPHLIFPILICAIIILFLFLTPKGKRFIDGLSIETLTWMHVLRLPVEICLVMLATHKQIPYSMTFEGHNFDILSGLTAPIIAWWGIRKKKLPRKVILGWNIIALTLVLVVSVTGIGAIPSPMQAWDLQQPNYAVMHFPFIWLPAFIVPLVIFSHLVGIRRFWNK